ncbi:MAG TPA: hypothetical protein VF787_27280, partial [Thermoanaerobaculia bacterium]
MSRRTIVALIATLVIATPLFAAGAASDDACTREALPRTQTLVIAAAQIDTLFAASEAAESIETDTGVTIEMPAMEVVVARVGADGKLVLGCVDSAAAAKRFFETPVE